MSKNKSQRYLERVATESEVVGSLTVLSRELSPKSEEDDDSKEELVSKSMDSAKETPPLPKSATTLASFSPINASPSNPTKKSRPFCEIFALLSASTNQASVLG